MRKENEIFYGAGLSAWKKGALCTGLSAALLFASLPAMAATAAPAKEKLAEMAVEQQNSVSGVVYDENGEALIGASVMVKGTQNGTAPTWTDASRSTSSRAPRSLSPIWVTPHRR